MKKACQTMKQLHVSFSNCIVSHGVRFPTHCQSAGQQPLHNKAVFVTNRRTLEQDYSFPSCIMTKFSQRMQTPHIVSTNINSNSLIENAKFPQFNKIKNALLHSHSQLRPHIVHFTHRMHPYVGEKAERLITLLASAEDETEKCLGKPMPRKSWNHFQHVQYII